MRNLRWMFVLTLMITAITAAAVAQDIESEYVLESRLLESELGQYLEARERERQAISEVRAVAAQLDEAMANPNSSVSEMRRLEVRLTAARDTAVLRLKETSAARERMYDRMDRLADLGTRMEQRQPEPVRETEGGPNGLWKFRFRGVDVHALVDLSFQTGGVDRSFIAVGDYRTSNGHRGTVRGSFRANRLELEVMDSRRGKVAYLDGTVSSDGRLQGSWQAVESGLAPDRPMGGAWTAQRVSADTELELD